LILSRFASEGSLCFTLSGRKLRQRGVGQGEQVSIGPFLEAFVEANSGELPFSISGRVPDARRTHFPAPAPQSHRERHGGHSHAIAVLFERKAFQKTSTPEARVGAMKFLVESAHEDNAPEAIRWRASSGCGGGALEHEIRAVFLEVRRLTLGAQNTSMARAMESLSRSVSGVGRER